LSTGPRNNITLFLVGLFLVANLGLNILKSSLSTGGLELPDLLEFIIFLMVLLPPYHDQGKIIEQDLQLWYNQFAKNALIITGVITLIIGILLILISFPWKQYLVLRVRYAQDFKLRTSISNDFISKLYSRLYETEMVAPPRKFKKWHFPWLKDERVEEIADMEQIQYLNRVIGTFALITGSIRLWIGIRDVADFNSIEFLLWIVVTLIDILTITFSLRFSTRESEFVITNKRIIFSQEVKQISGVTGKRYFFISDLKRNDIASFEFTKVTTFAVQYLLAALALFYLSIALIPTSLIISAFLGFFVILLFAYVYQTYVGFSLKTKSGDKWVMRHQLANPATRLRQFIGDEQSVFSRLLANRLEEKEIINSIQVLRAPQTGLEPKRFEQLVGQQMERSEEQELEDSLNKSKFVSKRFRNKDKSKNSRHRVQLTLEDILLSKERVVWDKVIPYPLNWRYLTLLVGSVVFVLALPTMYFIIFNFNINTQSRTIQFQNAQPVLAFICVFTTILLYLIFHLKFFSLRRKSIVITQKRLFYEELVRPPRWLFFLGIFRESIIKETMIDQLQVIGSGKYLLGGYNWSKFKQYLKSVIFYSIIYYLILHLYLLINSYWSTLPYVEQIAFVIQAILFGLGVIIVWSAANMSVFLIQSWPTLEINASGIGVDFRLPYLTQLEAEQAQYSMWTGVEPSKKKNNLRDQRRLRSEERP